MLENISEEIFYYSVIPVAVNAFIILILLLIGKKNEDNYYKYSYFIKVFLSILIAFILSIMIGYTIWVYERLVYLDTVSSNILYMSLLMILVLSLLLSLIIMVVKLYKEIKVKGENEPKKELQK